ncbi:MAG: hypothetical protein SXV54_14010 [Chloroflexota bacterium]|nr:hypothetical protein [Chloroflexota bacterium]
MANGRNPDGTFKKGHKFGVGNKGNRRVRSEEWLQRFDACVSEEEFREVVEALIARAKKSDQAAKILLGYLIGKPRQQIDFSATEDTRLAYTEALEKVYGESLH